MNRTILSQSLSFKDWLQHKIGYQFRTSKDVESRLKRCRKYTDIEAEDDIEKLLFEMSQNPDFQKLKSPVKSQLRKSLRLYKQYQEEKNS
ncbi:hypothetical protein VSK92_16425 [Bacillus swezeyi]|uniref:hypothetical protein n=1 Tax=Bacillus swezeyi TaxID=1925020 RepID=UPI0039C60844